MCTSVALKFKDMYFGRNMDVTASRCDRVAITPRSMKLSFRCGVDIPSHYAIMGTAAIVDGYPLYADCINEVGLCFAGLELRANAYYSNEKADGKYNVSPYELPLWLLSQCASVAEVRRLMENTNISNIPYSSDIPLTPLHWHVADKSGSIVIESTRDGLFIYDDPVRTLTNDPTFDVQMLYLSEFRNLSAKPASNAFSVVSDELSGGNGSGTCGLPGGYSSSSRFVRSAFLCMVTEKFSDMDEEKSVAHFFRVLYATAVPRGAVVTERGEHHYTHYSCCMNATKGIYCCFSEDSYRPFVLDMHKCDLDSDAVLSFNIK